MSLMTLHASKGLEFPHVTIVGLEEEILPHRTSIEEDMVEEERRLFYVGITRAKRYLCITSAAKRKQYGDIFETIPSRFLDEIPNHCIRRVGFAKETEEQGEEKKKSARANLRALFS